MLKKIALVMLLALPMGVFAQNLKFGHINAQEIITVMPEFTKAQNDIQTLEKQLTAELQRTQEEFNKKYQEFQQAIAKDSLPPNIAERRQKELQDMMQRQEQFQQDAHLQMETARLSRFQFRFHLSGSCGYRHRGYDLCRRAKRIHLLRPVFHDSRAPCKEDRDFMD